jgi:hypothetical protein
MTFAPPDCVDSKASPPAPRKLGDTPRGASASPLRPRKRRKALFGEPRLGSRISNENENPPVRVVLAGADHDSVDHPSDVGAYGGAGGSPNDSNAARLARTLAALRLRRSPARPRRGWGCRRPALDAPVALFQMLHDRVSDYPLLILGKQSARAANEIESFTDSPPDAQLQFFVIRPRHTGE